MQAVTILTVPGLGSSGPAHWQTHWEQHHGCRRVQQHDWQHPVCTNWVAALDAAVAAAPGPVVLVAHNLACATVAASTLSLTFANLGSVREVDG